jgi:hypothetical protein
VALAAVRGSRWLVDRRRRAILGIPASRSASALYPRQSDHMPLRCMLVDDSEAFLEAASLLLEREGVTIVGVALSIAEAVRGGPRTAAGRRAGRHRTRGGERL